MLMMQPSTIPLIDRLRLVGELWVNRGEGSLARLGKLVMNDNGYFNRIETNSSTTTASLEKFARFFADPGNWPDADIPDDVRAFVHVVGITPVDAGATTGNINQLSGGTT